MKTNTLFIFFLPTVLSLLAASCGGGGNLSGGKEEMKPARAGSEIKFDYARNISVEDYDSFKVARLVNPWDTTKMLHTYILVADTLDVPSDIPSGTLIRTPIKHAIVYSAVHTNLLMELGAGETVKGVCDAQFFHDEEMTRRLADGRVTDCGNSQSPNIEKILSVRPDAIMLSPYENSGANAKASEAGVPIIECADYMEPEPLGRAEWMKFYGMLMGCETTTDSIWAMTERDYNAVKSRVSETSGKPKVLMDGLYGSAWYIPSASSYTACLIRDAGGENPFDQDYKSGVNGLSGEQVLMTASDADVWLYRYNQSGEKSLKELNDENKLYGRFKAMKDNNVWGCNTQTNYYYEDIPFHPHKLLKEMAQIFHPEGGNEAELNYFKKMN